MSHPRVALASQAVTHLLILPLEQKPITVKQRLLEYCCSPGLLSVSLSTVSGISNMVRCHAYQGVLKTPKCNDICSTKQRHSRSSLGWCQTAGREMGENYQTGKGREMESHLYFVLFVMFNTGRVKSVKVGKELWHFLKSILSNVSVPNLNRAPLPAHAENDIRTDLCSHVCPGVSRLCIDPLL